MSEYCSPGSLNDEIVTQTESRCLTSFNSGIGTTTRLVFDATLGYSPFSAEAFRRDAGAQRATIYAVSKTMRNVLESSVTISNIQDNSGNRLLVLAAGAVTTSVTYRIDVVIEPMGFQYSAAAYTSLVSQMKASVTVGAVRKICKQAGIPIFNTTLFEDNSFDTGDVTHSEPFVFYIESHAPTLSPTAPPPDSFPSSALLVGLSVSLAVLFCFFCIIALVFCFKRNNNRSKYAVSQVAIEDESPPDALDDPVTFETKLSDQDDKPLFVTTDLDQSINSQILRGSHKHKLPPMPLYVGESREPLEPNDKPKLKPRRGATSPSGDSPNYSPPRPRIRGGSHAYSAERSRERRIAPGLGQLNIPEAAIERPMSVADTLEDSTELLAPHMQRKIRTFASIARNSSFDSSVQQTNENSTHTLHGEGSIQVDFPGAVSVSELSPRTLNGGNSVHSRSHKRKGRKRTGTSRPPPGPRSPSVSMHDRRYDSSSSPTRPEAGAHQHPNFKRFSVLNTDSTPSTPPPSRPVPLPPITQVDDVIAFASHGEPVYVPDTSVADFSVVGSVTTVGGGRRHHRKKADSHKRPGPGEHSR